MIGSDFFRPAQNLPVETNPLEPEMQAEKIGKAHPPMHFGGGSGDKAMDFTRVRFRMADHERSLVGRRIERVGGIPYERTARFVTSSHFRAHVLDRLKAADHTPELFALPGIVDRLFDHSLACTKAIGGQYHPAGIA